MKRKRKQPDAESTAPGCFVSEQPGEECKGKQEKGWKMDARRNASRRLTAKKNAKRMLEGMPACS